eukprot:gb/GECG01013066.1/.p1 GENE.gb/GECG01013066.1/~~gb/GECG01013066.1/.p1  ORF type:complete len:208 (+),score=37.47 gb/GECG01013066.1/:1-624(+)
MPPKSSRSGAKSGGGGSEEYLEHLLNLANKEYVKPELSFVEWPEPNETLDEEIIQRGKKVFERFDTASTGYIATSELGACLRALGFYPTVKEVKGYGSAVEEDGRIDYTGWLKVLARIKGDEYSQDAAIAAFKKFDPENRGYVTLAKCREILGKLGDEPMNPGMVEHLMQYADPDDAGEVDYVAFVQRVIAEASQPPPDLGEKKKKK